MSERLAKQQRRKINLPPLWSNPAAPADQKRFILDPHRISIAATATKTGKTWGCAEWYVLKAFEKPNCVGWWIAPSVYQAKIGFERVLALLPRDIIKVNFSLMTVTLPNGTRLEFKTGEKPNLLFGQQVDFAVIDEAARMREEAYIAVTTTMTRTQGPLRIASNTDQGKQNWFYGLYLRGVSGDDPDIASYQMRTYDNPYIPDIAIVRMKRDLPPHAYAALVEAQFPDEAANVFRNLERNITNEIDITLPVIEQPIFGVQYLAGLDLAKYHDFSVLTILRMPEKKVAYYLRINRMDWEEQMTLFAEVTKRYNGALTLIDSTGVGDPIFEALQRRHGMNVADYRFTNQTKQQLIDKLAIGIERGELKIPRGCKQFIAELQSYIFEVSEHGIVSFHAPDNAYDDSVISLALAYWAAANPFVIGYASSEKRSVSAVEKTPRHADSATWKKQRGF